MRQNATRDFSVGFVFFVATILLVSGLFLVGDGGGLLTAQVEHHILVENASGLQIGSQVKLSGVTVGKVSEIDFAPELNKVRVTLSIHKRHVERIGTTSTAWLKNEGLLGDTAVHISMGNDASRLPVGSTIPYRPRYLLEQLAGPETTETTNDFLGTLTAIFKDVRRGEGSLGQLLKNPELYENLNEFSKTMRIATEEVERVGREVSVLLQSIREQKGTLGKLIFSEDYAAQISRVMASSETLIAHLEVISGKIERGEGSLGKFVADSKLHDGVERTLKSISRTAWRLETLMTAVEDSDSVAGKLLADGEMGLQFKSLIQNVDRSTASLAKILEIIEEGDGSLGMLVHDPSIASSLRDVFLGVQDVGYLQNVVRHAERVGRTLDDSQLDREQRREVIRLRALAKARARDDRIPVEQNASVGASLDGGEMATSTDVEKQKAFRVKPSSVPVRSSGGERSLPTNE